MKGANTPVDPEGEERKGGAQNIAKAFLSAGDDRLCIYLHVPENLSKVRKREGEREMSDSAKIGGQPCRVVRHAGQDCQGDRCAGAQR